MECASLLQMGSSRVRPPRRRHRLFAVRDSLLQLLIELLL
jgi:hypothetical protein